MFEHLPCGFSRLARKRRSAAPPGFHLPYPHLFGNFCESFDPGSCKVMLPGQVKWPYLTKTWQSRPSPSPTVFEGKLWNFRNMIRSSVPTKSRIFDIGDLRSGHFRDLPIRGSGGKPDTISISCRWGQIACNMNSNFVQIHSIINILQHPGSIERLVAPDYYFNDLEKWHEFYMPKKGRGNPATVSPQPLLRLLESNLLCCDLLVAVLYKPLWT